MASAGAMADFARMPTQKKVLVFAAAPDARDIRQAFLTHSRRQFPGGVEARILLDAQATRANILDGLRWLAGKVKGSKVTARLVKDRLDRELVKRQMICRYGERLTEFRAPGLRRLARARVDQIE